VNMKPARIIIVILSVIFLLAALFACGGKSRIGSLQIAPDTATPQPPAELSIDDVLADIDAAKPPPGVDPAIYNSLKEALREQLLSIYSGKIVCTPPTGPENEITDFAFESAEEDSFNFTWSYINVGDYDQDGTVGISDITPIAMFYGEPADTPDAEVVDGDGDGAIGISDITPLAIHYGNNVDHYVIRGTESEGVEPDEEIGTVPFSEGTAGSRLRFSRIYFCGTARFFRIFAVDSTGNIGAGSRTPAVALPLKLTQTLTGGTCSSTESAARRLAVTCSSCGTSSPTASLTPPAAVEAAAQSLSPIPIPAPASKARCTHILLKARTWQRCGYTTMRATSAPPQ